MKTDAADQPMKVGEYLDAWLDHVRGRVRVRTWEGYECLLRVNAKPVLGGKTLSELHALDLQRLYGSLLKKGLCQAGKGFRYHLRRAGIA